MSDATQRLNEFVLNQVEKMTRVWQDSGTEFPSFARPYSLDEKKQNETLLAGELGWLINTLESAEGKAHRQAEITREAGQRLKAAGKAIFELTDPQVNTMENEGIPAVSSQFFEAGRRFDPQIRTAELFQASRNVWTMNYLQVLLDLPVRLTPSVFAYSMLYPVSDNYLDDARISGEQKMAFNRRFSGWLAGENNRPTNEHEQKVLRLVRMMEGEFPRDGYPQVYASLLAIQSAQQKSLMQHFDRHGDAIANLRIAIEKGGTSVLADGMLTAGSLPEREMEIIFNYGVFAQFMDDQEDVADDLKQKAVSVFSEAARKGKLDATMNRLFSFSRTVLKDLNSFDHARSKPLKEISLKGIDMLLIDACARTSRFYSRRYLESLEAYFPFRFKYLAGIRKQIEKKKPLLNRFMDGVATSNGSQVPEWVLAIARN